MPAIEGIQRRRIRCNNTTWTMITVYNRNGEKKKLSELGKWLGEMTEEGKLIIGGDFNARIGTEGSRDTGYGQDEAWERRRACDTVANAEGEALLELIADRGWTVANGNIAGDEEGAMTYIKVHHRTTIDYVLCSEEAWEDVAEMRVLDRVDSDHQPLAVRIRGEAREMSKGPDRKEVQGWKEEDIETYKSKIERAEWTEKDPRALWADLAATVNEATVKREAKAVWKTGKNEWWDEDCRGAKKELRKQWKKARKGSVEEDYIVFKRMRSEYRELCNTKRNGWLHEEEELLGLIRSETEAWNYVNKKRKKRTGVSDKIAMEEWTAHFMETLGGVDRKPEVRWAEEDLDGEKGPDIRLEEVMEQINKLKKKKAAGGDGIRNEAWIYGQDKLARWLWTVIKGVWEGRGYPDVWRDGVITPVHKRGSTEEAQNYRGITLTATAYKIYASIINKRLLEEMEGEGKFDDSQAGFRKGRGTMDNVYVLNHVIQTRITRTRGKVYLVFIDLKAAFDKLDREVLWKAMENLGINASIIRSAKEIYQETRCKIKIGDKLSDSFWVDKGVRQGCPLSPTLFNIYISDLEKVLRRGQDGGVVVGDRKIWSLGYADDIVLMAETQEDLIAMISRAAKYFEKRKLEVNTDKTKVMVCSKGGGNRTEVIWKWGEKTLKETNVIDYLGYRITRTGEQGAQAKERVRKARLAMGAIWSIGERFFRGDIRWRLKLFDSVVKSTMMYGVEIWGWKEWKMMESLHETYLRWILGVERTTPGYIVTEELKRDKMRVSAGGRAAGYEERIRYEATKKLPAECIKDRARRERRGETTKWSEQREMYLNRCGGSSAWLEETLRRGGGTKELLVERDRDVQAQERWEKIVESRSAERYKYIRVEGIPEYLREKKRGSRNKDVRTIARLRCGNEESGKKYWLGEEDRRCRICGREEETLEHLTSRCREELRWEEGLDSLMGEEGRGKDWGTTLASIREDVRRSREAEWVEQGTGGRAGDR